jgi:hypothetical protein
VFFPTVQAKTGLTGFPNWSDRFRPVGCREVFLSKESLLCHGFFCSDVERLLRWFGVFGEVLDKVGLTGLPNRSYRFPLPA